MSQTFATAINCMDGRVQEPVIKWMKDQYNVEYIDMLTEPGPDQLLADTDLGDLPGLQEKINISVEQHGSNVVALAGHGDCAGNPVDASQHHTHIKQGVQRLQQHLTEVEVIGLWINEQWEVEQIV